MGQRRSIGGQLEINREGHSTEFISFSKFWELTGWPSCIRRRWRFCSIFTRFSALLRRKRQGRYWSLFFDAQCWRNKDAPSINHGPTYSFSVRIHSLRMPKWTIRRNLRNLWPNELTILETFLQTTLFTSSPPIASNVTMATSAAFQLLLTEAESSRQAVLLWSRALPVVAMHSDERRLYTIRKKWHRSYILVFSREEPMTLADHRRCDIPWAFPLQTTQIRRSFRRLRAMATVCSVGGSE